MDWFWACGFEIVNALEVSEVKEDDYGCEFHSPLVVWHDTEDQEVSNAQSKHKPNHGSRVRLCKCWRFTVSEMCLVTIQQLSPCHSSQTCKCFAC